MGRKKIDPALHKSPKVFGAAAIKAQLAAANVQRIPGSNRTTIPHRPPDLEAMNGEQLDSFVASYSAAWGAKRMFPTRPKRYPLAARTLIRMASLRAMYLRHPQWDKYRREFERLYQQLPRYAQWRQYLNPLACVAPGKSFRRTPRKIGRDGKQH